jgi:hypothetical protein
MAGCLDRLHLVLHDGADVPNDALSFGSGTDDPSGDRDFAYRGQFFQQFDDPTWSAPLTGRSR